MFDQPKVELWLSLCGGLKAQTADGDFQTQFGMSVSSICEKEEASRTFSSLPDFQLFSGICILGRGHIRCHESVLASNWGVLRCSPQ